MAGRGCVPFDDVEERVPEGAPELQALRASAMRVLSWEPGRDFVKAGVRHRARARGRVLEATGRVPDIATIFLASSPKAGSQWAKALFDHPIVADHTKLCPLPQRDYQAVKPTRFPAGTIVPGLYVGYDHYLKIPKPLPYRTVYVFRDPRELVVSAYFSAVATHRLIGDLAPIREQLKQMSVTDGITYFTKLLGFRLREMATWVGVEDDHVLFCKLEEIGRDPRSNIERIFKHCEVNLTPEEFETVLHDVSREELQQKDLAARKKGEESHYRVKREGYKELFTPEHYALIEEIVPGLVADLGYS